MRKYFFTLDLEEWVHLEYMKKYAVNNKNLLYSDKVLPLFEFLAENEIKSTVFVVGEIAQQNRNIIKEIYRMGIEIACHGWTHSLIYNMTDDEFFKEAKSNKAVLEDIISDNVYGFRAPCFSMTNTKLGVLKECGFKYDASFIKFKEHKLYNVMDMSSYNLNSQRHYNYDSGVTAMWM